MRNKLLATAMAVGLTVLATACPSVKPSAFNMAYLIGGGIEDGEAVKQVSMPGTFDKKESDDNTKLIYANPRNWNVRRVPSADQQRPWKGMTRASEDGKDPGFPIEGQAITLSALNRPDGSDPCKPDSKSSACRALFAFFPYCMKYGCDIDEADDPEAQELSSDGGWMAMLREGLATALDHAWTKVIAEYGPEIENQPSKWPEIGEKMGVVFAAEMRTVVGLPEGVDIFCNTNVIAGERCTPPVIQFHTIRVRRSKAAATAVADRRDQEIRTQTELDRIAAEKLVQEEQQKLDEQKANDNAVLQATPGWAAEQARRAELDKINACAAPVDSNGNPVASDAKCVVILGGGGTSTQVQVP